MTVGQIRRLFYRGGRDLGDFQAMENGRYPERIARRAVYRNWNRLLRYLLK